MSCLTAREKKHENNERERKQTPGDLEWSATTLGSRNKQGQSPVSRRGGDMGRRVGRKKIVWISRKRTRIHVDCWRKERGCLRCASRSSAGCRKCNRARAVPLSLASGPTGERANKPAGKPCRVRLPRPRRSFLPSLRPASPSASRRGTEPASAAKKVEGRNSNGHGFTHVARQCAPPKMWHPERIIIK